MGAFVGIVELGTARLPLRSLGSFHLSLGPVCGEDVWVFACKIKALRLAKPQTKGLPSPPAQVFSAQEILDTLG